MGAEPADPGAPTGLVLVLAAGNCGFSPACSIPGAGHGVAPGAEQGRVPAECPRTGCGDIAALTGFVGVTGSWIYL